MEEREYVIKIPEEVKNRLCFGVTYVKDIQTVCEALHNGTPLPKGHGRLKDIDKIISDGRSKGFCDWYDEMKYAETIIEADKGERSNKG